MRVATYARVGTIGTRRPSNLEHRQQRLAAYVAAQPGWRHTGSYADVGCGHLDRAGLSRLLDDAAAGRIDLVVVRAREELAWDRRSRRAVLDRLARAGIGIRSLHTAQRAALTGLIDLTFVDWLWEGPR